MAVLSLAMSAVFLSAHARYPGLPSAPGEAGGWSTWSDQSQYLAAAQAWARGDLNPTRHTYPPGYALLGAWLLWLTPHDRFLLPNLGSLIICQFACAALARRLFPSLRWAGVIGAAAFMLPSVGTPLGLRSWLVPWSTTPAAAMALLTLVAVLRLVEQPGTVRAVTAGAALGAVLLFRPTDAAPLGLAAALVLLPALWALPLQRAMVLAAVAFLACAIMSGLALGLIGVSSGFGPDSYVMQSRAIGFEWRLLPLRWVMFMIDPRPLLDGVGAERLEPGLHLSLAEAFVWVIPGVAGAAACCASRRCRPVHALLAIWIAAYLAMMLCYRDLHILGFWLYGNYHYFKVLQPVLLLLALALPFGLWNGSLRWRQIFACLLAVVLGFGWRADLVQEPQTAFSAAPDGVRLPDLSTLQSAAIVAGQGGWTPIYSGDHTITIAGQVFHHTRDFKLYPRAGDLLLVPLRPLPPGSGVLRPAAGLALDTSPVPVGQTIVFGLPCLFGLAGSNVCGQRGAPLIGP